MSNIIVDYEKGLTAVEGSNYGVNITDTVQKELDLWQGLTEEKPQAYPQLEKYWNYVKFGDGWTPTGTPWSSAFISYVLRDQQFPKQAAHRLYTEDIINNKYPSWRAFSIPKTERLQLHVGDVLVKPRTGDYNNTHGDVVYKIQDGIAYLVGGNVSNTAKIVKTYKVDKNGFVLQDVSPYLVILKKKASQTKTYMPILIAVVLGSILFMRKT